MLELLHVQMLKILNIDAWKYFFFFEAWIRALISNLKIPNGSDDINKIETEFLRKGMFPHKRLPSKLEH